MLFFDTDQSGKPPSEPFIVRSRFVKVNLRLLLDENGQPRQVKEITLNLFPDVTFTGVITGVEQSGDSVTWVGSLKDVEYSQLNMIYTGGVFIGHFASPSGVYEISMAGDDLYRIIKIDQSKLPGE